MEESRFVSTALRRAMYAHERYSHLSTRLVQLAGQLGTTTPPVSDTDDLVQRSSLDDHAPLPLGAIEPRLAVLRTAFQAIDTEQNRRPLTAARLKTLVERTFPSVRGANADADGRRDEDERAQMQEEERRTKTETTLLLARMTLAAYTVVVEELFDEAVRLETEDEWWSAVEEETWRVVLYLVQTTPSRAISLLSVGLQRLRELTSTSLRSSTTPSLSLLSLSTFRQAIPPSLLLTSLFPHLSSTLHPLSRSPSPSLIPTPTSTSTSTNRARLSRQTRRPLFLTMSPVLLTRQEVASQRWKIKQARETLAQQLGEITLSLNDPSNLGGLLSQLDRFDSPTLDQLSQSTASTLSLLLRVSPSLSPASPLSLPHTLHHLLSTSLPTHISSFTLSLAHLRRPSLLTRSWPYLLAGPLAALITARTVYSGRTTIRKWASAARETVEGFVWDWVVGPVKGILDTLRHGEDTLALMGKDSLRSDLESLERMVVDFGRSEYRLNDFELQQVALKVRSGDLTDVLRAWEKDIKNPLRSAVAGNLIQCLLIQIQKGKVDAGIALDGIQKMLRSQQLTFGFVGVAPSLIVLLGVMQWLKTLLSSDGGRKTAREYKRRNWSTMRHLDAILSPLSSSTSITTSSLQSKFHTQGFLLLELHSLRSYATSRYFPTKDTQLRESFLEDVRVLEEEGVRADVGVRRAMVERLWRWGGALGWSEIV